MPVYNEAACIGPVCRDWLSTLAGFPSARLLVVDDGSTDDSPSIIERLAAEQEPLLVDRQPNRGHGGAVRRGYELALELGCDWVFQVDSDGQFDARDFEKLWDCRDRSDFILGWRSARKDSRLRRWLSRVHRGIIFLLYGVWLRDPNTPFRLMRASLLARLLPAVPDTAFAPNVFLAILAKESGQDLIEVPVRHLARASGRGSIRRWKLMTVIVRCMKELALFRLARRRWSAAVCARQPGE